MASEKTFHMTPEEFRRHGHAVVDWIADYYGRIESFPVLSRLEPGQIRASLPADPPLQGRSLSRDSGRHRKADSARHHALAIAEFLRLLSFECFRAGDSWRPAFFRPGRAGNAVGHQPGLHRTGDPCAGLAGAHAGSAAEVSFHQQRRRRHPGHGFERVAVRAAGGAGAGHELCQQPRGCDGKLVAYTSSQAHSSLEKGAQIAGIGRDNLRLIEVDENFAMRPEALARQIEQDRRAGLIPFFVCATVGTTSSNAIDPVPEIGRICGEHKLWLHVDAAMSGTAALCPEFRHTHAGLEFADSYCFNPHKWMFTNFDCDCFYVADRKALIQTLSVLPEYLRNQATETGAVIDYRDWQIPLGRRFRALKLWFVIRHYGVEGLQHHIRQHVALAQQFAGWVRNDDRFELAAPVPLNLVCFRHRGGDEINQTLMDRLNRSGDLYLTHTRLNGRLTLRLCVGQTNTTERHVEKAWKRIQEEAAKLG